MIGVLLLALGFVLGCAVGFACRLDRMYRRGVKAGRISEANAHGVVAAAMHRMVLDMGAQQRAYSNEPLVSRDIKPTREQAWGGGR